MAEVLFKKVDYSLKKLIEDIAMGEIGLPDIQRPFVWPMTKVRDLFDSMYRGFPIGYLLFWENGYPGTHRTIGDGQKQKVARLLIVDGQQRLTSLYAVMKAEPVVTKDFKHQRIKIAFHPLSERFEASNPAIEKDAEWIPDINILWQLDTDVFIFMEEFLKRLSTKRTLSTEEVKKIRTNVSKLIKLEDYPLTALEISSSVDEDQVADIFVRINSQGTPLNQANFILTLMSVFWDEGRKELEEFCRRSKAPSPGGSPSPFNHYLRPNPDQLLRVSVALGFRRARLEHVYSLLRGKDLETRQFSDEQREKQFALLQEAQAYTLDLQNWHEFFKVLKRAGYPSDQLISSQMAVLYTYALWLIGKRDFRVDLHRLREVMARWFFMVAPTGRYTGSPETRFEQDMALLRGANTADDFVRILDEQISAVLTKDYWEVTLPNELETAAARSTGQFAYYAALCLLEARVLYSKMKVSELLDPTTKAKKSALERHHLFPRKYLLRIGIREKRLINQVANYALVEWSDNIKISDRAPKEYVPELEKQKCFASDELQQMYEWHALPPNWYELDYRDFVNERKKRIALVIKSGFEKLGVDV
ncbi:MAG: GmrSD restriction endonuclease domain-containing protein [Candidatus Bipolaricaulaceae bacterium]